METRREHKDHVPVKRMRLTDLDIYQCGAEVCVAGHSFGPAVRDHYLVHFVLDGHGFFHADGRIHALKPGDGFLICPDQVTFYRADTQDPWHYAWVGFHGTKAATLLKQAGLSQETPIFHNDSVYLRDCFAQMIQTQSLDAGRELRLTGLLHLFLSQLLEESGTRNATDADTDRAELHVRRAMEYFEKNYSRHIGVSDAALHVGLNRSYFTTLFKAFTGQSPQEHLTHLRLEKAIGLMHNPALSIGDIARSVGYFDPLLFSKVFRKHKQKPPSEYRRLLGL